MCRIEPYAMPPMGCRSHEVSVQVFAGQDPVKVWGAPTVQVTPQGQTPASRLTISAVNGVTVIVDGLSWTEMPLATAVFWLVFVSVPSWVTLKIGVSSQPVPGV